MGIKAGVEPLELWEAVRQGATGRQRTFISFLPLTYHRTYGLVLISSVLCLSPFARLHYSVHRLLSTHRLFFLFSSPWFHFHTTSRYDHAHPYHNHHPLTLALLSLIFTYLLNLSLPYIDTIKYITCHVYITRNSECMNLAYSLTAFPDFRRKFRESDILRVRHRRS